MRAARGADDLYLVTVANLEIEHLDRDGRLDGFSFPKHSAKPPHLDMAADPLHAHGGRVIFNPVSCCLTPDRQKRTHGATT